MVTKRDSRNVPEITAREGDGGNEIAHESKTQMFLSTKENDRCPVMCCRNRSSGSAQVPHRRKPTRGARKSKRDAASTACAEKAAMW